MILAVNTGSSSVRLAAFDGTRALDRKRFERGQGDLRVFGEPEIVVHRVVHGGGRFSAPTEIDDQVFGQIEALVPLAPLHQPFAIEWIRKARAEFPRARQFAAFDTGFFTPLPAVARTYALPPSVGARRYGFHGLAHAAMWRQLQRARGRAITLQLGGGCSATAILDGKPLDTSMGLTPLEGLVMGTRGGNIDPSVLEFLHHKEGLGFNEIDALLNKQSGLLGVSGLTNDMRELLEEERVHQDRRARLAIDIFCLRVKHYLGSYLAQMNGAEAIVFTGGIGENSPEVRSRVCRGMDFLGICLDEERNQAAVGGKEGDVAAESARVRAYVNPTNEELLIARDTVRCVRNAPRRW